MHELEHLNAESASIRNLVAENINAVSARISTIEADYVKTETITAINAEINSLKTNKITYNQAKGILTEGFYASFSGLSVGGNQLVVKTLSLPSGSFDVFAPGGWT